MDHPAAPLRILVIDDDPATLDVVAYALALDGHAVVRACDVPRPSVPQSFSAGCR